jgi:hypothetical protein
MIMPADLSIAETVRQLVKIAKTALQENRTHLPTAVIHTLTGTVPMVLPFKEEDQKKAMVDYVKNQALEMHAYAVTMITSAHIVDSRTGKKEECLVLATTIQRGKPHVMVQHFVRDEATEAVVFGDLVEGEDAALPGQMMIFPDWDEETCH